MSAYRDTSDKIVVTIGGSIKTNSAAIGVAGILGGMVGGALVTVLVDAFDAYSSTKSTRFDGLFDNDFNHLNQTIQKNKFEIIKDFRTNLSSKETKFISIFYKNENYLFGNFNALSRQFSVYQI